MVSVNHSERKQVHHKLKWLMSIRLLFALFLLGATVAYQLSNRLNEATPSIALLYMLAGAMIFLCALYGTFFSTDHRYLHFFIISQIVVDSLFISLVIFATGGYASVFPFLYLLVIIYASVFIYKNGSFVVATISAAQYTLLLFLQAKGVIDPFGYGEVVSAGGLGVDQLIQKCGILTVACYAVAFLSGYLSEQDKRSKAELQAMEAHLSRVQNLAQIGEMASGLAHEIKNPLASISGAVQLLNSEIKEEENTNKQLMNIVLKETDRLSDLVNNFLTFARPVVGHEKCVNLPRVIAQTVELLKQDNSVQRRIDVEMDSISAAYIKIDPLQLRQVLWNLLLNGAESIEDKGRIKVAVDKQKDGRVQVEISDNGCGMDEKTISSIFNPFFTTKSKGTGLGLSIVYRILETYGCRMDVKSKPSVGSVFTLHFKTVEPVIA
jgi:two-component system sensor histidine kinase HydH